MTSTGPGDSVDATRRARTRTRDRAGRDHGLCVHARSGSTGWRPTRRSRLSFAVHETLDGLLGGSTCSGSPHFNGDFARLVPAFARPPRPRGRLAWALSGVDRAVAPPRRAGGARASARAHARPDVGRRHAGAVRASLRQGVLLHDGRGGVPRLPRGQRRGDRLGRPDRAPRAARRGAGRASCGAAHERDWRIAILGASEACLPLYAERGLHALYHGDEAIVETAPFSLEGRAIRKVRQSVHRARERRLHRGRRCVRASWTPGLRRRARGRRARVARRRRPSGGS